MTDDTNRDSDDDSTEPETPISDALRDLEGVVRGMSEEIREGIEEAERVHGHGRRRRDHHRPPLSLDALIEDAHERAEEMIDRLEAAEEAADGEDGAVHIDIEDAYRERAEELREEAEEDEEERLYLEEGLDAIREAQGRSLHDAFHGQAFDQPPAEARFCPACQSSLSGDDVDWFADELLNRYRTRFTCEECGFRGEIIRHGIGREDGS